MILETTHEIQSGLLDLLEGLLELDDAERTECLELLIRACRRKLGLPETTPRERPN
jgi:hypothetical protein